MSIYNKNLNTGTNEKKSKIYDCFMFFNELEILNLRFEYLSPYVDFFVLVESRKTTQGNPKPLFYDKNKLKFKKYAHKIKHLIIDDFPKSIDSWSRETLQRNYAISALSKCDDSDLILVSDVDEIPNLSKIPKKLNDGVVYHFLQDHFRYYANTYKENHIIWEGGTKIVTFKTIRDNLIDEAFVKYGETFKDEFNLGASLSKIRLYRKTYLIYNGGFHFSYFGGISRILKKLESFPHEELIKSGKYTEEFISDQLSKGIDIINSDHKIYRLPNKEILEISRKLLPEFFFNVNCRVQNKFIYKLNRYIEIIKIFFRSLLRIAFLTFLRFIYKVLKKSLKKT